MRPTNTLDLMVWAHLHSFDKITEGALSSCWQTAKSFSSQLNGKSLSPPTLTSVC
jgi:hypothetical protein